MPEDTFSLGAAHVLAISTFWVNSVDDKLMVLFLHFSLGDNMHEMSKPVFGGKIRKGFQNVVC